MSTIRGELVGGNLTVLTALAPPEVTDRLAEILFRETTTIGVRWSEVRRRRLPRPRPPRAEQVVSRSSSRPEGPPPIDRGTHG